MQDPRDVELREIYYPELEQLARENIVTADGQSEAFRSLRALLFALISSNFRSCFGLFPAPFAQVLVVCFVLCEGLLSCSIFIQFWLSFGSISAHFSFNFGSISAQFRPRLAQFWLKSVCAIRSSGQVRGVRGDTEVHGAQGERLLR